LQRLKRDWIRGRTGEIIEGDKKEFQGSDENATILTFDSDFKTAEGTGV